MAVYGRQVGLGPLWRPLLALLALSAAALVLGAPWARADETLVACGLSPNNVFAPTTAAGFYLTQSCGVPNAQLSIAPTSTTGGTRAFWAADAPSGLLIDHIRIGIATARSGRLRRNDASAFPTSGTLTHDSKSTHMATKDQPARVECRWIDGAILTSLSK